MNNSSRRAIITPIISPPISPPEMAFGDSNLSTEEDGFVEEGGGFVDEGGGSVEVVGGIVVEGGLEDEGFVVVCLGGDDVVVVVSVETSQSGA